MTAAQKAKDSAPDLVEPSQAAKDVVLAALAFCANPHRLGGLAIASHAGPVRELLLSFIRSEISSSADYRWKKLPLHIQDERLLGGIDLPATLQMGKPILQKGLLAQADGGVILLPMAERASGELIARLSQVMDRHEVLVQRDGLSVSMPADFGLIALDESDAPDESLSAALKDRLGFHLNLHGLSLADLRAAIAELSELAELGIEGHNNLLVQEPPGMEVLVSEDALSVLCATALALGVDSVRATLFALIAARTFAQLFGRSSVGEDELAMAARTVLAPRATQMPGEELSSQENEEDQEEQEEQIERQEPQEQNSEEQKTQQAKEDFASADDPIGAPQEADRLKDVVLQAAKAAIPAGLLSSLLMMSSRSASLRHGRSGALSRTGQRGRPVGVVAGMPDGKRRLSLMDTLRAAAPWQRVRAQQAINSDAKVLRARVQVRQDDFRVRRFQSRTQTTTIFVVDASGSSALHRLAEAKGAVELLLADCYVRRDQVAVIAFRGRAAEVVLPPTRSLARAKRCLSGLPGGGGTPLASALDAAYVLSQSILRRSETPIIVMLTDAKANVSRDGTPGRAKAHEEALAAATLIRASGVTAILVDTSAGASELAQQISARMHARYLALPHAGASEVAQAVKSLS